jgi:hypothetical protein
MNRRTFVSTLALAVAARAADEKKTRYYAFDRYRLQQGTQTARVHEWLSNAIIPRMSKLNAGPIIVLEAVIAPHTPEVVMITGFQKFDDIQTVQTKLGADPDLQAAYKKFETGSEPPFESLATAVLEATAYSPEVAIEKHPKPRYFEIRQYHSPTWSQLRALHERFAGPEIKVFHKVGIFPILYTSTLIGDNMPNLTYLIPFDSLAAREKAWDAFAVDPDWIKARKESIDRSGQITIVNQISIYRATAYSPVS